MDEDAFRAFYEHRAAPVGLSGAVHRRPGARGRPDAGDLLPPPAPRLVRGRGPPPQRAVRTATNLWRTRRHAAAPPAAGNDEGGATASTAGPARTDLARAMARLKPAQRKMVWLAYVQGASHAEIAEALGLKAASIRLLLFRARKQLARFLRSDG